MQISPKSIIDFAEWITEAFSLKVNGDINDEICFIYFDLYIKYII